MFFLINRMTRLNTSKAYKLKYFYTIILPPLFIAAVVPTCIGYGNFGNIALTFALLITSRSSKITLFATCFILALISTYIPVGLYFGKLQLAYIVSALQTNQSEAKEFLHSISPLSILLTLSCISTLVFFGKTTKIISSTKRVRRLTLILFSLLLIKSYPIRMLTNAVTYYSQSKSALDNLSIQASTPDKFTVLSSHPRYSNNVIVIGESVLADYLSVYGYSHDTTPWLKSAPGYFLSNYISAAPNTFLSLPRTLTISNGLTNEQSSNAVALANKAGFNTIWISNQGYIGEFDTPASMISSKAHIKFFLKKGDYESRNTDDFYMLKKVNEFINKKGNKVVFIHMIGSHPNPCLRLNNFPVRLKISNSEKFNCYIASITKLDAFIKKTVDILKASKQTYSLTYFSDHGMTVDQSPNAVRHGVTYKQNYKVPFFILTSDKYEHKIINNPISAYSFLSIFQWITGIKTREIKSKSPEKITEKKIMVFDGERMIPFQELPETQIYQ